MMSWTPIDIHEIEFETFLNPPLPILVHRGPNPTRWRLGRWDCGKFLTPGLTCLQFNDSYRWPMWELRFSDPSSSFNDRIYRDRYPDPRWKLGSRSGPKPLFDRTILHLNLILNLIRTLLRGTPRPNSRHCLIDEGIPLLPQLGEGGEGGEGDVGDVGDVGFKV